MDDAVVVVDALGADVVVPLLVVLLAAVELDAGGLPPPPAQPDTATRPHTTTRLSAAAYLCLELTRGPLPRHSNVPERTRV